LPNQKLIDPKIEAMNDGKYIGALALAIQIQVEKSNIMS